MALAMAFWGALAAAQEATDEAPAEEAPAQTEADPFQDLGESADQAENLPFIRAEYNDWALRCIRDAEGQDQCQLYQLLFAPDGSPISEVSLVPILDAGPAVAGVVVVVPLETLLPARLTLRVDGGEGRRYDYDFCNLAGCVARFGLEQSQVDQFKRGSQAVLTLVPAGAPDQVIELPLSLRGFTAGYDALEDELNN